MNEEILEEIFEGIIGIIVITIIFIPGIIGIIKYGDGKPSLKEKEGLLKKETPDNKSSDKVGFCKNCGKKIDDDAKFCKYCGAEIILENESISINEKENKVELKKEIIQQKKPHFNKLSVTSFILSIIPIFTGLDLLGVIALILGIVGLSQSSKTKERGKVLAIIAIILGAVFGIILDLIENNI